LAERERGGGWGWAGSGVSWAGWLPGAAQVGCWFSLFYFFISVFFFFCFRNLFWVLKGLLNSDLNKSQADHLWSLESVFTTYKPEV
jgi:hypothetical protein